VLLYNFTAVTGVNLFPARSSGSRRTRTSSAMKETGGDVAQVADLVSQTPDRFTVLAGAPRAGTRMMCVGAAGGILALANALPTPCMHSLRAHSGGPPRRRDRSSAAARARRAVSSRTHGRERRRTACRA